MKGNKSHITEDGDNIKINVTRKLWRKEYTGQHHEQNGKRKFKGRRIKYLNGKQ